MKESRGCGQPGISFPVNNYKTDAMVSGMEGARYELLKYSITDIGGVNVYLLIWISYKLQLPIAATHKDLLKNTQRNSGKSEE